jgi:hypothetical protein
VVLSAASRTEDRGFESPTRFKVSAFYIALLLYETYYALLCIAFVLLKNGNNLGVTVVSYKAATSRYGAFLE